MALAGASGGGMSPSQRTGLWFFLTTESSCRTLWLRVLTVLEDSLHVEAVGGAGFIVSAAFEVVGQFSGSAVVDHSWVG